uniref:Na+/K+/2Cl-cotransporter protein n=1 Tax=Hirondellea gigas TaxID=1518452 RepID=A0A6A7FYV2_9CRUS
MGSGSDTMELQSNRGDDAHGAVSSHYSVYETKYQKSLRHYLTREALPKESNYRNLQSIVDGSSARPTLDELHDSTYHGQQGISSNAQTDDPEDPGKKKGGKVIKFGWLEGVLMRCLLNIWGVMLFLRVSWMVGQAGLWQALSIVISANLVTTITAISMSAVATNGLIEGGGVYYMISRSLGPEFGGSIGLMFTLANSIAVSTYIIGFVNSMQDMLYYYFDGLQIVDGGLNDVRALGTGVLVALMALAIVGMEWVTRVQMGLLFLLIGSQIDFLIGAFVGPLDDESQARGFVGLSAVVFNENMGADYRPVDGQEQGFFSVFAVFFPAVTGIVAGANLSGDLKNPGEAIPKGTLLAIAITLVTYIIYPFLIAATVVRDATGDVEAFQDFIYNNTGYLNGSLTVLDAPTFGLDNCYNPAENITECKFGLTNNFQVMELISAWGPLIYAGCFAATLSSAIASLVGAPRVLQALAKDKLYPGLHIFAKGYGGNNDPIRGYVLVFILSLGCIMIGDLNLVSTLLSNFFLASYSLINFSCFHASLIKSPGWRPAFTYYNQWVSLAGGIMCLAVMFLIDYVTALITFIITVALYLFVSYRKPDVNWGSSTQAATYVSALKATLDLQTVEEHVKNYRPQILVLSGPPSTRPPLVDLGQLITKNISMLSCGHIAQKMDWRQRSVLIKRSNNWLTRHKIRSFYHLVEAEDLEKGALNMFQLVGLGKLKPNMVLLGYKSNWNKCDRADLKAYFNTLHAALNMQLGIAILRVPAGLDYSQIIEDEDAAPPTQPYINGGHTDLADVVDPSLQQQGQLAQDGTGSEASTPPGSPSTERANTVVISAEEAAANAKKKKRRGSLSSLYHGPGGAKLSKDVMNNITIFKRKLKKATIDVWWLYDDGGLTLLLPYILTTRSNWSGCTLRIFALANRKDELDVEQRSMATLLSKFRIDYGDVIVIPDAMRKASESARADFEQSIEEFKTDDETGDGCTLTETELFSQKDKTNRHIRLREMLIENSMEANLIVMTLPMPRKTQVSASLYMAWLDYISKDMPPFLFVRGNQQSVLTFYS